MIKLNNIFQDKAVFQQKKSLPVWGKTASNSRVKVEFAGNTAYGKANDAGYFKIYMPAVEAGGPYVLTVTDLNNGESVNFNDILVGEVWLASGQSNMEYPLNAEWATLNSSNEKDLNRKQEKEFVETVNGTDQFRFITVQRNASCIEEESFSGEWKCMTPENAPQCSAVAAWFGKYIKEKLNVPVGLIVSAWGGTIAEAWTSRAGLLSNPDTVQLVNNLDELYLESDAWNKTQADAVKVAIPEAYADTGNKGVGWGWANPDFNDCAWTTMKVPGSWINQKISGNGSLWVRKEINLSGEWQGKDLMLELGGIDKMDITYFNGVEIGRTGKDLETEWYDKPRNYEIPSSLVRAGRNVIAIRAYSFLYDGGFCGRNDIYNLVIKGTDTKINISGDWKACAENDLGILVGNAVPFGVGNPNTYSILFNGMIKPLLPYAIKGAIWYQGESNANNIANSESYLGKLEAMIRDWYYNFAQGEFPFIQVQLAYYNRGDEELCNEGSTWAVLRENQRLLCEKMDKVYMASAIDIGDHTDIHPQDKKSVGFRLAQNALHNAYFVNEAVPSGPLYKNFAVEGSKIRVFFEHADGMYLKKDMPQSFYVAGAERKFYPADEVIVDGSSLILSSAKIKYPAAVRYAWADDPVSTLFNGAGFPASSFQTDEV